jgi:Lytic transglycolase
MLSHGLLHSLSGILDAKRIASLGACRSDYLLCRPASDAQSTKGDICLCKLSDLHPTQASVPDGLTAAHKSLPFGTCLVVENPRSGKKVRVTVNDRGLVLDLSWGAARAIGMLATQSVNMRRC